MQPNNRLRLHWLCVSSIFGLNLFRIGVSICFLLLSSCALLAPSQDTPLRLVQVKVLADPALREENPRWRETLEALLEAASDYLEDEFGIRMIVNSIIPWQLAERSTSTLVLLSQLKKTFPLKQEARSIDLIIGFTGSKVDTYGVGKARVNRLGNCQEGLANYMISSVSAPFRYLGKESQLEWDVLALIHEMGHIFGAEHTDETISIMHHEFAYRSQFDLQNSKIILKNKYCPFGKG